MDTNPMQQMLLVIASAVWIASVAAFIFRFRPRRREVVVTRFVSERRIEARSVEFTVGEQTATVSVPFEYEVQKPVHCVTTREPTREEQLRFFSLSGGVSLLFFYFLIVIVSFGHCMWAGTDPSRVLEVQLTGTITFLVGVFVGVTAPTAQATPEDGSN